MVTKLGNVSRWPVINKAFVAFKAGQAEMQQKAAAGDFAGLFSPPASITGFWPVAISELVKQEVIPAGTHAEAADHLHVDSDTGEVTWDHATQAGKRKALANATAAFAAGDLDDC